MINVWSYGGGTQSVAIAVLVLQGKLPRPDYICIADTKREKQTTWQYLAEFVQPALEAQGMAVHKIDKDEFAYRHDDLFNNSGRLLIPAFSSSTEDGGKLSAFCSTYWKKEPVENFMSRKFGVMPSQTRKWIGFSLDEPKRYLRMMKGDDYKAGRLWFPLVEEASKSRSDCVKLVQDYGWPKPPRSSCWMCPNMLDDEWQSLSQEEFQMAVQLEKELQKRDPDAWLHKSKAPISEVEFKPTENGREYCEQGVCFV